MDVMDELKKIKKFSEGKIIPKKEKNLLILKKYAELPSTKEEKDPELVNAIKYCLDYVTSLEILLKQYNHLANDISSKRMELFESNMPTFFNLTSPEYRFSSAVREDFYSDLFEERD